MRIFASFSFLLLTFHVFGQVYLNHTFDNPDFTNENVTNIEISSNGMYIVPSTGVFAEGDLLGGFFLTELNQDASQTQMVPSFTTANHNIYLNYSEAFISTDDGGYLQATACDSSILVKYDSNLNLEWMFASDTITSFLCTIQLHNGNYLVCGYTYATNKIELIWLNEQGESYLAKQLDPFSWAEFYFVLRIIELDNGELLMGGYTNVGFDGNQMMLRCDNEGNLLWAQHWDRFEVDWAAWPLVDNAQYATVAFSHVDWTESPWIIGDDSIHGRLGTMKVDLETGDTSEVILYPEELYAYWITDFIATPDGGYAMLGYEGIDNAMILRSFILKINANREQEWMKRYSHQPIDTNIEQLSQAWDLEIAPDSGFVVAGGWNDLIGQGKQVPWVFKTDPCGDLQWSNCGVINVSEKDNLPLGFSIYPNPAGNVLNLTTHESAMSHTICIYDATGKIVASEQWMPFAERYSLNIADLENGLYLVQITDEMGVRNCRQFVKVENN